MTTGTELGLQIGQLAEDWSGDARYFEYSTAADPIGAGTIPTMPVETFPSSLHEGGPSRIVPLDISLALGIEGGPATSPALLAHFIHIRPDDEVTTTPNATSELYYVLRGSGFSSYKGSVVTWQEGDFMAMPAGSPVTHHATEDAAMYWVVDEPLLRYLGVRADVPRFSPTKGPPRNCSNGRTPPDQPGCRRNRAT